MDSSGWTVGDHVVHSATDDDFQHFLDISAMGNLADGINYDFHSFQSSAGPHQMDTAMTGTGTDVPLLLSPAMPSMQQQVPAITTTAPYQPIQTTMMPPPTPSEAIVNSIDAQIHFLQQQKLHAQQHQLEEQAAFFAHQQTRIIPPTPQSLELPPGSNPFYAQHNARDAQQPQQPVDYRYQRAKEQTDMSFTPLVSPAVTPLDTHFPVQSQFTVPGAYFSPLTSPALHAQPDPMASFEQRHASMAVSSPVDMDLDSGVLPILPNPSAGEPPKKTRKNAAKARAKAGVKQSPISKPLRKRTATTPSLNAQALNELMESAEQSQDYQQLPTAMIHPSSASTTTGPTDSENGSISPEALNDSISPIEMPPPPLPKPKSARPSPYIAPQGAGGGSGNLQPILVGIASPATPASLMRLSSPNNRNPGSRAGSQEVIDTEHIEVFELPESANFPQPTVPANSNKEKETLTPKQPTKEGKKSSKTPALAPLPSPKLVGNASATGATTQSPRLVAGPSNASRKTPQLLPRGTKRGSLSSVPISPALRPKISPSIKPLLPGGPDVEESASLLLATKSNYQRILEGKTVPGVTYPTELSTNLTHKRTSHKIAEQGRRNRINSALQEIATLLPKSARDSEGEGSDRKEKDEKDKDKSGAGGVPNSKASTVEMAIEYIKQLKQEVAAANKRAEEAERKLDEQKGVSMDSSS